MRPSCDGTSATSLISCVWTDIRTTLVIGSTMPMPGDSVDDDTLPKKSFTPTLPAGTVRNGPAMRKRMTRITAPTTSPTRDGRGSCTVGILEKSESTLHLPFTRDQISAAFRPAASDVAIRAGQVRV